jgi:hypothetical protein
MQDNLIREEFADGVLHYIDEFSGDYIKSSAGRVEGRLDRQSFSFCLGRPLRTFLRASRLISRLLRLERINVLKISASRLLVIYMGEVFVYDIHTGILSAVYKFQRTRYVHTQSIAVSGSQIVVGEYGKVGPFKDVGVLASNDAGITWRYFPLFARGSTKNILAVKYDDIGDQYWIFTGDSETESEIALFDRDFNRKASIGRGLDFRAISSFYLPTKVVWLTDNPFGESGVFVYDRESGKISAGHSLPGPVWYCTEVGGKAYACTAAEDVSGAAGQNVYLLSSGDYVNWQTVCQFRKDRLDKRLFLYGLGTFPVHSARTENIYVNFDAVRGYDGCCAKIAPGIASAVV